MKSVRTVEMIALWTILANLICVFFLSETQAQNVRTIAAYNIKGTSMTSSRMAEVTKVVQYINADCVALQEVNSYTKGDDESSFTFHNWLADLMKNGGMNYSYFLNTDKGNKSYYGIGMLTKEKPVRMTTKLINNPGGNTDKTAANDYGENRGLIIVEFDDYCYIGAHFSLVANYRKVMIDWITDTIQTFTKPVFIGGDFNMTWTTTPMPYLKNAGFNNNMTGTNYTFPSTGPNKCIDFVIGMESSLINSLGYTFMPHGGGLILGSGADLAVASDHLPIFTRFSIGTNTGTNLPDSGEGKCKIYSLQNIIRIENIHTGSIVRIYNQSGQLLLNENDVSDCVNISFKRERKIVFVEIIMENITFITKMLH